MTSGKMIPLSITEYTLTTALGQGRNSNLKALLNQHSGLTPLNGFGADDLTTWVGEIKDIDQVVLPQALKDYQCRNNQLAWLALQQDAFIPAVTGAINRYGRDRVGVFIGTSTSGTLQTELAYQMAENEQLPDWYLYRTSHDIHSVTDFVQRSLGLTGAAITLSTACSSSAKAFASAYRAMALGICDAAVVGGVDSLCQTTLYGFNALQLLADSPCQPFDKNRSGISIGEAGGFALLEKKPDSPLALLGYGEVSDAYHMSSPHPDGEGARRAMHAALNKAGLLASMLDYINLHGTGTPANDRVEARAVASLGVTGALSSTKGYTGHTLGASGIVEAAFSLLALEHSFIPPNLNLHQPDPPLEIILSPGIVRQPVHHVLSNSFGFGGNNCSLVFGANP